MSEDMTAPVTRADLREELAKYPTREELKAELKAELAKYATREELKAELAKYATREDLKAELANYSTREELKEELAKFRVEFRAEINEDLARHINAGFEMMRQTFAILADQDKAQNDRHASLARRVDVLEVAVFDPPKP